MRSVREVLEGVETAVTPDGATPFHGLKQEIRLNKVVFHHDDRAAPILDGADLTIPRGENYRACRAERLRQDDDRHPARGSMNPPRAGY